jgi:hypothetical protein
MASGMFKVKRWRTPWALKTGGGTVIVQLTLDERAGIVVDALKGASGEFLNVQWVRRWKQVVAVWPKGRTEEAQALIRLLVHIQQMIAVDRPYGGLSWGPRSVEGLAQGGIRVIICEQGYIENVPEMPPAGV